MLWIFGPPPFLSPSSPIDLEFDRFLAIISGEPTSGDGDDIVLRSARLYGFWDVFEVNCAMTMVLGNESCTVSRKLDRVSFQVPEAPGEQRLFALEVASQVVEDEHRREERGESVNL